jgi:hypothetical protein
VSAPPIVSLATYAQAVARLAQPFARPDAELQALGLDAARYEQASREWAAALRAQPTLRREFSLLYREEALALAGSGFGSRAGAAAPPVPPNPDETALGTVPALGPILPFVAGAFRPVTEPSPARARPHSEPNPDETQALGIVLEETLPFARKKGRSG